MRMLGVLYQTGLLERLGQMRKRWDADSKLGWSRPVGVWVSLRHCGVFNESIRGRETGLNRPGWQRNARLVDNMDMTDACWCSEMLQGGSAGARVEA